jgi:plastocyanin
MSARATASCLLQLTLWGPLGATALHAQSVLDATPNVGGASWVAPVGVVQFNMLHRFDVGPAPTHKVTNVPSLVFAYGLTDFLSAGLTYGSNSDLVQAVPNEWEFFGRFAALSQHHGGPVDAVIQGGYNNAARSGDFALTLARTVGRVRLLGTGVLLSHAFDSSATRGVVGGGALVRITSGLALAGDASMLLDRRASEDVAWSAGIQLGVARTPHSLSLHASNVGTRTLAGIARGTGAVRYGFEYSIPITIARYTRRAPRVTPPAAATPSAPASGEATVVEIRSLKFGKSRLEVRPGTTVEWRNQDPLVHTVTATDGSFNSGDIPPGGAWRHRFDSPGTYEVHCTPHPFMRAIVTVR